MQPVQPAERVNFSAAIAITNALHSLHPEDGSCMVLQNIGILTTSLHGVTTQKTEASILITMKTSSLVLSKVFSNFSRVS
jgi:hypothetical protein